jgi:hypothetical protein
MYPDHRETRGSYESPAIHPVYNPVRYDWAVGLASLLVLAAGLLLVG